jgi:hypothetical protein
MPVKTLRNANITLGSGRHHSVGQMAELSQGAPEWWQGIYVLG